MLSILVSWRRAVLALIAGGAATSAFAAPAEPSDSAFWVAVAVGYVVATGVMLWHFNRMQVVYELGWDDGAEAIADAVVAQRDADAYPESMAPPSPVVNYAEIEAR